jgi:hypothetical protein
MSQTSMSPDKQVPKIKINYLTIAYRYGQTNNHWYVVYMGDDQDKAMALAEDEVAERGGKYGVATFKVADTQAPELSYRTMLCYYASSLNETLPYHAYRYDELMDMGMILEDYVQGYVYRVEEHNPQTPAFVEKVSIEPNDIVVKETKRRKEKYSMLTQAQTQRLEVYREG